MSEYKKREGEINYSNLHYIRRKAVSPSTSSSSTGRLSVRSIPTIYGSTSEGVYTRKDEVVSDRSPDALSCPQTTRKRDSSTKIETECTIFTPERKLSKNASALFLKTTPLKLGLNSSGPYTARYYRSKISQLNQMITQKDSEIEKLKGTVSDLKKTCQAKKGIKSACIKACGSEKILPNRGWNESIRKERPSIIRQSRVPNQISARETKIPVAKELDRAKNSEQLKVRLDLVKQKMMGHLILEEKVVKKLLMKRKKTSA